MSGMLPLSEEDLYHYWRIRDSLPRNDPRHAIYGPMEHRQFTQEAVERNPWMALPLAAAIPAYTGLKALGLTNARSPASMDEIWAGYHGLTEGMLNHLVPSAQAGNSRRQQSGGTVRKVDGTMHSNTTRRTRHGGGGVRG